MYLYPHCYYHLNDSDTIFLNNQENNFCSHFIIFRKRQTGKETNVVQLFIMHKELCYLLFTCYPMYFPSDLGDQYYCSQFTDEETYNQRG